MASDVASTIHQSLNGGGWRNPEWLGQANRRGKLAAPVEGIVRSPVLEGYRNKSEFSVAGTGG